MKLQGKVALVTGASSGIGRAIADELARQGAAVTVNYFRNRDGASALCSEIAARGGRAVAVKADVRRKDGVEGLFKEHMEAFGRLDILVNNAGDMVKRVPTDEIPEDLWRDIIDLNLSSAFFCCQKAIPVMRAQKYGRIINVSSVGGRTGGAAGAIPYHSAKGGLIALTRGLAKEVASDGIVVNAVAPGIIGTAFHDRHTNLDQLEGWLRTLIPLQRAGKPEEIAKAAAFLASDDASYMTGATLDVNGGMAMY